MKPTPTINVNLKPHLMSCHNRTPERHTFGCPGTPVLIPCPIPRSVTFTVRLGECNCPSQARGVSALWPSGHAPQCPARPLRVTCSISGKTWEESEVVEVEKRGDQWLDQFEENAALRICRERWALVKMLVLGMGILSERTRELQVQRDAVYASIADMARAEDAVWQAQERACRSVDSAFIPDNFMNAEPHSRPSASILERYVERLIEQIGVLS